MRPGSGKFCLEMRFVTAWDAAAKKLKTWVFGAGGVVNEMTYVGLEDGKHVWDAETVIAPADKRVLPARIIEDPTGQTIQILDADAKPLVTFTDWKKSSSLRFPRNTVPYAPDLPSN